MRPRPSRLVFFSIMGVEDDSGSVPLDSSDRASANAQLDLPAGPGEVVTLRERGLAAEDGDFDSNVIYRYSVDYQ